MGIFLTVLVEDAKVNNEGSFTYTFPTSGSSYGGKFEAQSPSMFHFGIKSVVIVYLWMDLI